MRGGPLSFPLILAATLPLTAAVVAATGCDDAPPGCALDDYLTCFAPAECHFWVRFNVVFGAQGEDFCLSYQRGPRSVALAELAADVAAGLRDYDATRAAECAAFFTAIDCSDGQRPPLPEACKTMVTGLVPVGGACLEDVHCVNAAYCARDTTMACSVGACVAFPAVGAPCDPEIGCGADARCLGEAPATPTCYAFAPGAACVFGSCGYGHDCVGGTCQPAPGLDMPCSMEAGCADPHRWVGAARPRPGRVCLARDRVGGPCATFGAHPDLWCDRPDPAQNGTCRALPAELGEPCEPGVSPCRPPLVCDPVSATCVAFEVLAEGAACGAPTSACDWQHYCDGTCRPLRADGEPCSNVFECASFGCDGAPQVCGPRDVCAPPPG